MAAAARAAAAVSGCGESDRVASYPLEEASPFWMGELRARARGRWEEEARGGVGLSERPPLWDDSGWEVLGRLVGDGERLKAGRWAGGDGGGTTGLSGVGESDPFCDAEFCFCALGHTPSPTSSRSRQRSAEADVSVKVTRRE